MPSISAIGRVSPHKAVSGSNGVRRQIKVCQRGRGGIGEIRLLSGGIKFCCSLTSMCASAVTELRPCCQSYLSSIYIDGEQPSPSRQSSGGDLDILSRISNSEPICLPGRQILCSGTLPALRNAFASQRGSVG